MKLFRLALPAVALAALVSAYPAVAEENPVRQFFNEEFSKAQPADDAGAAPAANQAVNVEAEKPEATNKNAWAGLVPVSAPAPRNALTPPVSSGADNAPILTLVDKHASANGIPAAFARAVVRIESNFNPRATGRAREVGLMQIKFETARGIGFTGTREELYDPDTNLRWGMKYLAMAWKLGGATPCGAVLRYQAGHAASQQTAASRAYCAKVNAHMASAN